MSKVRAPYPPRSCAPRQSPCLCRRVLIFGIKSKNKARKFSEPPGSRVLAFKMGPRRGGHPSPPPDSEYETDPNDDEMDGGNATANVNRDKHKKLNNKTPLKKHSWVKLDALKTFKVHHKNISGLQDFVIPVSNHFGLLEDKKAKKKTPVKEPNEAGNSEKKRQRIPPIIMPGVERSVVNNQLKFCKITNYRLKMTSVGTNVFLDTAEDHKRFRKLLDDSKVEYFTHDLPEEKHTRVVLKGLDNMDPNDVAKELEAMEVKPVDIRMQIPKQKRYTNHANFIVSYKRGDVNLKKVYAIRSLFHTMVRWEPYRSNFNGPTQCRRCLMPGHGTRHCTLRPNCAYCAGPHISEECDEMGKAIDEHKEKKKADGKPEENSIALNDFPAKCFNCVKNGFKNTDHIALSAKCPSKQHFAQLQRQLSTKSSPQQQRQKPKFAVQQNAFPPLPPSNNGIAFRGQQSSGHNPQPGLSTSRSNHQPMNFSQHMRNPSLPSKFPDPPNEINIDPSELFSFDEIMNLVNELLIDISNCSTRKEQFQVITRLTLKYVYGQSR